jgi:glycogen phosphorylase
VQAHEQVDAAYRDTARWAKMAILNTARVGKFSSDRTILEYAKDIWTLPSVAI